MGLGTTGIVAKSMNRKYIGSEISQDYVEIANKKIAEQNELPLFEKETFFPLSLF